MKCVDGKTTSVLRAEMTNEVGANERISVVVVRVDQSMISWSACALLYGTRMRSPCKKVELRSSGGAANGLSRSQQDIRVCPSSTISLLISLRFPLLLASLGCAPNSGLCDSFTKNERASEPSCSLNLSGAAVYLRDRKPCDSTSCIQENTASP